MIETVELLENPAFASALKTHQTGKGKTYTVAELDGEFSA
jgi:hypothetical protein